MEQYVNRVEKKMITAPFILTEQREPKFQSRPCLVGILKTTCELLMISNLVGASYRKCDEDFLGQSFVVKVPHPIILK
jgi:hypothetical protein